MYANGDAKLPIVEEKSTKLTGGRLENKGARVDEAYESNISTLAHLIDTDLTAAIRLILDRGWTNSYEQFLSEHTLRQKEAIKELCGKHYQDFVSSVESLVNVKYDINKLKGSIRCSRCAQREREGVKFEVLNNYNGTEDGGEGGRR
eukprot:312555-Amorphochlora_amoeboformis.AAC.2